ncbi:LCP family protein [Phytohabitans rumicis]|uniref:Transcriptional regulator n=1 Tax=Phytohabitans rumicis TaxID=1076125 RepID=A0A6V8L2B0_9ACTN|nr:LCP family protein [Phytohabitans rumicis]GFJ88237.1 transcriptional regulator [Phytohabitans rumicis]
MRVSRIVVLCLSVLVLVVAVAGLALHLLVQNRVRAMQTFPDPFAAIPASERPSASAERAQTILLAGIDSELDTSPGRSDALMLVRLTADRQHAYVVSLPRDSWVNIPGHGMDKVNAAYAYGGQTLAVRTVERLTGVRIDHVAVVDMAGFRDLTNALGGVVITVPEDVTDPHFVSFPAGTRRLDGAAALAYVRERRGLPRGDLDRVRRQQEFLKAVLEQMGQQEDPRRLAAALDAISHTVSVDKGFGTGEMMRLLLSFRKLRGEITFLTVPVKGTGQVGDASVVLLDTRVGPAFWKAVAADSLEDYLSAHDTELLTGPPR